MNLSLTLTSTIDLQTPAFPNACSPKPTVSGWNSIWDRHRSRRRTLGMRLSCNFVNVYTIAVQYTFTRVHARIPNGQPREEKRACRSSRRTSRRMPMIVVRVRLVASWTGKSPDTPTSARGSSRRSRRGCPCRCRSHGI